MLLGFGMLWAIWSDRSPFKIDTKKWSGPSNQQPSAGGGSGFS